MPILPNDGADLSGYHPFFDDMSTILRIQQASLALEDSFRPFIEEQLQNFALATGRIYSEADLARLRKEKRPTFQSNLFHYLLLKVSGDFKGNMPGIDITGRTRDDHRRAGMMKDINDFILYTGNDITYELAKAYVFAIIGRIGWIKQEHTYRYDDEGMVDIRFYNKFLKFDPNTSDRRFETCQYISDEAWLTPEELVTTYAYNNPELATLIYERSRAILGSDDKSRKMLARWAERMLNMVVEYGGEVKGYDADKLAFDIKGDFHSESGRFKAIDFYERRLFSTMHVYDRVEGFMYDFSDIIRIKETGADWYDKNKLQLALSRLRDTEPYIDEKNETRIHQTSTIPGLQLKAFDKLQQLQNKNFKFTAILCYDWHPDYLQTKSLIDVAKDPVKSYNHRDNTNLTYLMRSALGGAYIEKKYTKGFENQINSTKIGGMTVVGDGAIRNKGIMEKGVPPVNASIERYQALKQREVELITGLPPSSRGIAEFSGESGKHYQEKVQQADVMMEWASENAQAAMLQITRNNIFYVQNFFTEERVFKITFNRNEPYWLTINKQIAGEVLNNTQVGKYDVLLSTMPIGRIAKEIRKNRMVEMISLLSSLDPRYVDPKEIVEIYEPDNKDQWLLRIEMVEGQLAQEIQLQAAMKQMQGVSSFQNMLHQNVSSKLDNQGKLLNMRNQERDIGVKSVVEDKLISAGGGDEF